ncbi:MAG: hypothetical protein RMJ19_05790 [Gemmatales bacterium]|nr:hypothetical protein [Gemmatales bacterium]MCS7159964.1 hypothetical protein [Gemmatales bacterium]MDW8175163.1 hypothetical protein [Gemmatales bacterium]
MPLSALLSLFYVHIRALPVILGPTGQLMPYHGDVLRQQAVSQPAARFQLVLLGVRPEQAADLAYWTSETA